MNPPGQRFTLDGSDALEGQLQRTCAKVRDAVQRLVGPQRLEGLLLGGGYGRGEGGVLRAGTLIEDRPYNDLEFYVLAKGSALLAERMFAPGLHELGLSLTPAAGVDVEFKILSASKLRRSPPTMFYYDLVSGHHWLLGSDKLLGGCDHHRNGPAIPLSEATRLLMNRCTGLLFCAEHIGTRSLDPAQQDFVGRNLAKAQLGLGDVLLAAHHQYHWSCRTRHERLNALRLEGELGWAAALRPHHAAGVEFKLHPYRSTEELKRLAHRLEELTGLARQLWLWLEAQRLGVSFASISDYARTRVNLCPETKLLRNWLITLRSLGLKAAFGSGAPRYPRERLLRSLALLLFEPERIQEARDLALVQRALRSDAPGFRELVDAYRKLWERFN
jgi:hypothetical protein